MTRFALLVPVLLGLSCATAGAFEQPPIQSPQDKACRDEAKDKVFAAPDPDNLGPYAIGKQIYFACMARAEAAEKAAAKAGRKPRRAA